MSFLHFRRRVKLSLYCILQKRLHHVINTAWILAFWHYRGLGQGVAKAMYKEIHQLRSKTDLKFGLQHQLITDTWGKLHQYHSYIAYTVYVFNFWQKLIKFMVCAPAVVFGPLCLLTINGCILYDYLKLFLRLLNSQLSLHVARSSTTVFINTAVVSNQPSQHATVCTQVWRKNR